jgi:predicted Zn-dependent protease
MQDYFHRLADALTAELRGGEVFTSRFSSEDSDFVRFNHNQVRQAGHVTQHELWIDLICGQRHAAGTLTLAAEFDDDRARVAALLADLREKCQGLPEDPHLLYATEVRSTTRQGENRLPDPTAAVAEIQEAGQGRDLVGLYAAGGIRAGFANSLGQRNWFSTHNFNFDWSFYHAADKAVKTSYAGFDWDARQFARKVAWAREQLEVVAKPARTIQPGHYRIYLTPVALNDLTGLLGWGGFGLKAQRTRQTPLLKMIAGEARLSPTMTMLENTRDGVAPNFQEAGFLRPDQVPLIARGTLGDCLVSPRSAKEYGVPTNGASEGEAPQSFDVAAGAVPVDDVLHRLDTGVYVSNLWYLNYSDRNACRTTGMTRFATFWVQHGQVQGPLNVMRFDETLYRALGQNLAGLTAERELILDSDTYFGRSTRSSRMPGALIEDFTFTL